MRTAGKFAASFLVVTLLLVAGAGALAAAAAAGTSRNALLVVAAGSLVAFLVGLACLRRMRAELRASERELERTRLLVEGVDDHALVLLDREGRVGGWNAGAERLDGWPASDAVGAPFAHFFPPEDAAAGVPARLLEHARAEGRASHAGWRVRRDGARYWAETSVNALSDDDGAPIGWAVITRDLSERRAAEAERERLHDRERELRREAEHASAAKSHFLATMSHELRTPLNAVLGYAELLGLGVAGPITSGQRGYLDRIALSGRHLLGLIDDVLDFSRVESGKVAVFAAPARISSIAHAAVSLVRPQATARGLTIDVHCPGDEPSFTGDEHRVRQILVNLLSNAVKFTAAGGRITVTCGVDEASGGNGAARVFASVRDSGVGIAPSELERIFEPFVQLSPMHTRTVGGVGLGLAISRRFAEAMGGTLEVASTPGEGSTFTLRLPMAPALPRLGRERRAAIGQMIISSAGEIAAAMAEAMRRDPRIPLARSLSDAQLEDHVTALLADVGQTFAILDEDRDPASQAALMADGARIRDTLGELHGAQRRRLGMAEAELRREFELLRAEVTRVVRRGLAAASPQQSAEEAIRLVEHLLDDYERLSVWALDAAASVGPAAATPPEPPGLAP